MSPLSVHAHLLDIVFSQFWELPEASRPTLEMPKIAGVDLTWNCFALAKTVKKSPLEVTTQLANALNAADYGTAEAIAGFLNVRCEAKMKALLAKDLMNHELAPKPANQKTVVIDYVGANIGKTLHIAHICTPSIGQALVNTGRFMGYRVIGDGHIGDWGSLFGTLVIAWKKYGNENEFQQDAVEHLLQIYVKITADKDSDPTLEQQCRDAFKRMTEGDSELLALWQKFTSASLKVMDQTLALFEVHLDYNIGESFYEGLPLPKIGSQPDLKHSMRQCVDDLIAAGIATQNEDGSVGVEFAKETKIPSCVIRKRDGTHGYLASDLAAIRYRWDNWQPERIIYCIDVRQQLHLRQCFDIAQRSGWIGTETMEYIHAANGFISLKDGAMSTRKGKIIRLRDLVSEAFERTATILSEKQRHLSEENISAIAIGAIKYSYLSQDREKDVIFDWDKALSFEGNSGPYIQYASVRARKMLAKAFALGESAIPLDMTQLDANQLTPDDIALMMQIIFFEKAITDTWEKTKPHILAGALYSLAQTFSSWYAHTPSVVDESNEYLRTWRLSLVHHTAETFTVGAQLLAIPMPTEM